MYVQICVIGVGARSWCFSVTFHCTCYNQAATDGLPAFFVFCTMIAARRDGSWSPFDGLSASFSASDQALLRVRLLTSAEARDGLCVGFFFEREAPDCGYWRMWLTLASTDLGIGTQQAADESTETTTTKTTINKTIISNKTNKQTNKQWPITKVPIHKCCKKSVIFCSVGSLSPQESFLVASILDFLALKEWSREPWRPSSNCLEDDCSSVDGKRCLCIAWSVIILRMMRRTQTQCVCKLHKRKEIEDILARNRSPRTRGRKERDKRVHVCVKLHISIQHRILTCDDRFQNPSSSGHACIVPYRCPCLLQVADCCQACWCPPGEFSVLHSKFNQNNYIPF